VDLHVLDFPFKIVVLRESHHTGQTRGEVEVSLIHEVVDVARHDDRDLETVIERQSRTGDHCPRFAALDATVN
jgi:hypothetical protein